MAKKPASVRVVQQPKPAPAIAKDLAQPAPASDTPTNDIPALGRCIDVMIRNCQGELVVKPGIITRVYTNPDGSVASHVGAVIAMNPFGDETNTQDERAPIRPVLKYDSELNGPDTYCFAELGIAAA